MIKINQSFILWLSWISLKDYTINNKINVLYESKGFLVQCQTPGCTCIWLLHLPCKSMILLFPFIKISQCSLLVLSVLLLWHSQEYLLVTVWGIVVRNRIDRTMELLNVLYQFKYIYTWERDQWIWQTVFKSFKADTNFINLCLLIITTMI